MKKIFCILSILTITIPVFADDNPGTVPAVDTARVMASASYVQGAYDALDEAKQDNINVSQSSGAIVTAVSLNDDGKTVSVTRTNEITIPYGSANSSERATIWVQ